MYIHLKFSLTDKIQNTNKEKNPFVSVEWEKQIRGSEILWHAND